MGVEELMDELAARIERGDGFIMSLTIDPQADEVQAEFMPIEPKPAFATARSTYASIRDQVAPLWGVVSNGVQTLLGSTTIERR